MISASIPRPRIVLTALLSLLLLFAQQASARHALAHLGAQIERSQHSALELPSADACLECELLAAGTSAAPPASLPATFADVPAWIDVVVRAPRATFGAASSYLSRAPPRFLQSA